MKEKNQTMPEPISIDSEQDLRQHIRLICQRFNENPDISRLLLVNPVMALEDIGVQLSAQMRQHVMDALRFPAKLKAKIERLETELKADLETLGQPSELPMTAYKRAELLFRILQLKPLDVDLKDDSQIEELPAGRLRDYANKHPLVAKLAEYERARQGAVLFHPRQVYQDYKTGEKQHRWIKAVRFNV